MMQALQVVEKNVAPKFVTLDRPVVRPGTLLVQIEACGLNFADLLLIQGIYQETPCLPFTLGMELAGEVVAIGKGVRGHKVGTKVAVYSGQGGLAEYGVFSAKRCIKIPESLSVVDAAGFQIAYGTSHMALDYRAKLKAGETLLVLGAAGGVGLTAIELGKLMGAQVIAVARGSSKLEVAKITGADHVIDTETGNIREQVKELGGADVIYDPVGGDQFKDAFRACNPDGRILIIGFASGQLPAIPPNHLMVKNISVQGFNWGGYLKFNPDAVTHSLRKLMLWHEKGKLKPNISHVLPFKYAKEGLEMLRNRKSTGKIVVEIHRS